MISKVVGGIALGAVGVLAVIGVAVGLVDVDPSVIDAVGGAFDAQTIAYLGRIVPVEWIALCIALWRLNRSISRLLDGFTERFLNPLWDLCGGWFRRLTPPKPDPIEKLREQTGASPRARPKEEVGGD